MEQELNRTYFAAGKYGARITGTVTPLDRNRVEIGFEIQEGVAAKIRRINIVGNAAYDDEDLRDEFELQATGFLSFVTRSDRYSKSRLAADLETLRSFYLDRGYINFNVDSTQVTITPDKQEIYITINLTEGGRYVVRDIYLQGALIVPEEELFELVSVTRGEIFSRRQVTETSRSIGNRLGNEGYSFANVNAVPQIDEDDEVVDLTFYIDPGRRIYVRRIGFTGNDKTRDEVLRREVRQMEGGWISTEAIARSRLRLNRLGYFESVEVETRPVPGVSDQVDVEFSVKERPSGNILLGAGYSGAEGVLVELSVTEESVFGTGNRLRASYSNTDVRRDISFSWLNPYWTVDGVSREIEVYDRRTDASDANLADYQLDSIGAGATFGVPVSEYTRVNVGLGAEQTKFRIGPFASTEVRNFRSQNGGKFNTLLASASWAYDVRDSRFLPTTGSLTRLSSEVAVPGSDLTYYKVLARHQRLLPLPEEFVLVLDGEMGYGDGYGDTGELPLTENFFAGGLRSVRGFRANTLGPRDSRQQPLGGNLMAVGSAELLLPLPLARYENTVQVSSFFDIGNVYGPDEDFEADTLRYSAGLGMTWLSPVGPLTVSYSKPLKTIGNDSTQEFQLSFGTSF